MWSKELRGCVYHCPPRESVGQAVGIEDLSYEECQQLVHSRAFVGKPVLEEHSVSPVVGVITGMEQDPQTGSVYSTFKLRTDSDTYRKVAHREFLGLSLGHTVHPSWPRRRIEARELSVCKMGKRPGTVIVNAAANGHPVFATLKPMATSSVILNGMEFVRVPDQQPQLTMPAQPVTFRDNMGRDWVMNPSPVVNASLPTNSIPATAQSLGLQTAGNPMPFASNNGLTLPPAALNQYMQPAQPQQQQPVQQQPAQPVQQPVQQQQQQPVQPEQPERSKAKKRAAPEEETEAEAPQPVEKKAATKAPANVPKNADELTLKMEALKASNIPAQQKEEMMQLLLDNYEMQKQMSDNLQARASKAMEAIEADMRRRNLTEQLIKAWHDSATGLALADPLKSKSYIESLELQANGLTGSESSSSSMDIVSNPTLSRQIERYQKLISPVATQQPVQINASANFPLNGTLVVQNPNGTRSYFQPRVNFDASVMQAAQRHRVDIDPVKGMIIDGQAQRQEAQPNDTYSWK